MGVLIGWSMLSAILLSVSEIALHGFHTNISDTFIRKYLWKAESFYCLVSPLQSFHTTVDHHIDFMRVCNPMSLISGKLCMPYGSSCTLGCVWSTIYCHVFFFVPSQTVLGSIGMYMSSQPQYFHVIVGNIPIKTVTLNFN